jgi:hypothetical protein
MSNEIMIGIIEESLKKIISDLTIEAFQRGKYIIKSKGSSISCLPMSYAEVYGFKLGVYFMNKNKAIND